MTILDSDLAQGLTSKIVYNYLRNVLYNLRIFGINLLSYGYFNTLSRIRLLSVH
jgi:hypothetical protein